VRLEEVAIATVMTAETAVETVVVETTGEEMTATLVAEMTGERMIDLASNVIVIVVIVNPVTNTTGKIEMIVIDAMIEAVAREMTAIAVMTEVIVAAAAAVTTVVTAGIATVAATGIRRMGDGRPPCKCRLMAGISLILSLVVGCVCIRGSETYHYNTRLNTNSKAGEPLHMNLLLCPS